MTDLERIFREESGRILAGLLHAVGDFDLAEEALQEALAEALVQWGDQGAPDQPGAWLTTVARRRCLDLVRRQQRRDHHHRQLAPLVGSRAHEAEAVLTAADSLASSAGDDYLRLLFTCCHPSLSLNSQVALTLSTVAGLSREQIARAFLVSRTTIDQRLVRAKQKIHAARIPYRVPSSAMLPERLGGVLRVIYLVFNEGYAATEGAALVRRNLCEEAIHLARSTNQVLASHPEVEGLLALLLLQHSRHRARVSRNQVSQDPSTQSQPTQNQESDQESDQELVLLEDQDRRLWDRGLIAEGLGVLDTALLRGSPGPYQVQAAIAAVHARADTFDQTDWSEIVALYRALYRLQPSPVVELNEAVAVAFADGWDAGLDRLVSLEARPELGRYHYLFATKADLLRRLGRKDEALLAYEKALELCTNQLERRHLEKRRAELSVPDTDARRLES